jgi:hypothetical protein
MTPLVLALLALVGFGSGFVDAIGLETDRGSGVTPPPSCLGVTNPLLPRINPLFLCCREFRSSY